MFTAHYPTLNFATEFRDDQPEVASIYQRFWNTIKVSVVIKITTLRNDR